MFPQGLMQFIDFSIELAAKLCAVVIYTPIFLFAGIAMLLGGAILGRLYMRAQLLVKRVHSNAKAPIVGTLGGVVNGLGTSGRITCQNNH